MLSRGFADSTAVVLEGKAGLELTGQLWCGIDCREDLNDGEEDGASELPDPNSSKASRSALDLKPVGR